MNKLAALVVATALLGCGGATGRTPPASETSSRAPARAKSGATPAAAVAAGSEVHVLMTDRLGTAESKQGDPFVAHVEEPLVAVDGKILVTRGAILRGHVVQVTRAPAPRIDIAFDTIETRDGPVRVRALLVDVGGHGEVLTLRLGDPSDGGIAPSRSALGGGPPAEDTREGEVTVPEGAHVRLMLLDPLVPLGRR